MEQLRSMVLICLTTMVNGVEGEGNGAQQSAEYGLDLSEDNGVEQSEEHDIDC